MRWRLNVGYKKSRKLTFCFYPAQLFSQMAKKFQDLTGVIAHDKRANRGKYRPRWIDIATYTDNRDISEDIRGTATHTKKRLLENDPSVGTHPVKISWTALELENNVGVSTTNTGTMDEILTQLVREIKGMRTQLERVGADVALQTEVVGKIRADRGCHLCQGDARHSSGAVESEWSDMEPSQDPSARPSYYWVQYALVANEMRLGILISNSPTNDAIPAKRGSSH